MLSDEPITVRLDAAAGEEDRLHRPQWSRPGPL